MILEMKERLRICAELAGSGDALAQKAAIPRRTLETYLTGEADLKVPRLVAIALAVDVSVEWLATGQGPMRRGDLADAPVGAGIDRDLLARIHKGIAEVYRAENAKISADLLADEVARIYDDLVAAYDSPDDRLVGLKGMLQQLRRELRSPPLAGSANSKQAS